MRPLLLTLLVNPLFRYPSQSFAVARKTPPLEFPICRNLVHGASQRSHTTMPDLPQVDVEETARVEAPSTPPEDDTSSPDLGCAGAPGRPCTSAGEAAKAAKAAEAAGALPKLSAADFRAYNSMAEHMNYFHNHFRESWTLLHKACVDNRRPANLSLKQFISMGLRMCSQLSMHHAIEEQHIFPVLARKMPEFKAGRNAAELLRQHQEIHKGMDEFEEYLHRCRSGETELELRVMKEKMDSWGEVLWKHLDQEVETLGAENMRKYWTLEEMGRMPM